MQGYMVLARAIAFSPGNKAQTNLKDGSTLVVQARYDGRAYNWLHLWHINGSEVWESDMNIEVDKGAKLESLYEAPAGANIWTVV